MSAEIENFFFKFFFTEDAGSCSVKFLKQQFSAYKKASELPQGTQFHQGSVCNNFNDQIAVLISDCTYMFCITTYQTAKLTHAMNFIHALKSYGTPESDFYESVKSNSEPKISEITMLGELIPLNSRGLPLF